MIQESRVSSRFSFVVWMTRLSAFWTLRRVPLFGLSLSLRDQLAILIMWSLAAYMRASALSIGNYIFGMSTSSIRRRQLCWSWNDILLLFFRVRHFYFFLFNFPLPYCMTTSRNREQDEEFFQIILLICIRVVPSIISLSAAAQRTCFQRARRALVKNGQKLSAATI